MIQLFKYMYLFFFQGFPQWLSGKESICSVGEPGSSPGSGRSPGEGNGHPCQYSSLENPMDRRVLEGYSPRGPKESDTTEVTEYACMHIFFIKIFHF